MTVHEITNNINLLKRVIYLRDSRMVYIEIIYKYLKDKNVRK